MAILKQISSLEKLRLTDTPDLPELEHKKVFRGERFSYQIAVFDEGMSAFRVSADSSCREWIRIYAVRNAVMDHPNYVSCRDTDYITYEPGLMPDILQPLPAQNGLIQVLPKRAVSLWIRVDIPRQAEPGQYTVTLRLDKISEEDMKGRGGSKEPISLSRTMTLEVLPITLPEQELMVTQWFYADCIANAHRVEPYSEEHWTLIDRYMACAADIGINMLLTPVITPPLDTMYGVQRPNVQLLDITKEGSRYRFGFERLHRWIGLCRKNGIRYYEIAHLFSQWGMAYAPNIWGTEDGEYKLLFGWHVKADDRTYLDFLAQMLPALTEELEREGIREHTYFHISDEPKSDHLDRYQRFSDWIRPLICGCRRMDALSEVDFYDRGLVDCPVTASNRIKPFLEKHIADQWVYYCMGQRDAVSNRFLAMPSYRNRIMGLQMYKSRVKGFLQWGFNYYYSRCSGYPIDPYQTTSADLTFPSGDPFTVYPGKDGPILSLRALVFYEGLQDVSVCRLLESLAGREAVERMIDDEAGMTVDYERYPRSAEYLLRLREKMTDLIEDRMKAREAQEG